MKVHLKLPEQTITVEVGKSELVRALNDELMVKQGIPPCLQTLKLHGETLKENGLLCLYKITDGTTIEVEQKNSCDGGGCMQIFIKTEDGKTIPRGAHTFDRVFEFMEKVAEQLKIPKDTMDIQLLFNDKPLNTSLSLGANGVTDQSVLHVVSKAPMHFVVKTIDGKTAELLLDGHDSVKSLKDLIFHEIDVHPSMQIILFNDKLLDDENKSLKDYELVDKAVLWLIVNPMYFQEEKISISVSAPLNDKKLRLEVNPNDSVKSVVKMAADKLAIPKASLKFNDKFLAERDTLAKCGVSDGARLFFENSDCFQLHLMLPSGRTLLFEARPTTTVGRLTSKVSQHVNIPLDVIRLYFEDERLDHSETTLAENKIKNDSYIELIYRQCGC